MKKVRFISSSVNQNIVDKRKTWGGAKIGAQWSGFYKYVTITC